MIGRKVCLKIGPLLVAASLAVGFTLAAGDVCAEDGLPFAVGEQAQYAIKKVGIKAGTAALRFNGTETLDGQSVVSITFRATAMNFLDEEQIFLDEETFHPVRVVRNLNIWGSREQIIEYYDAAKGSVRIVKNAGGETTEEVIQRDAPLDNLYGVIYRFRRDGNFKIGETVRMNLPTKSVVLKLVEIDRISAGGRAQEAFLLESSPANYRVWFDRSERKVPLRIDGAVGFGNTAMILREYFSGQTRD